MVVLYKTLLCNMYPELGETLGYFLLKKVLVTLGQLRKKVSKFACNQRCLESKNQMLVITDEKT